MKDARRLGWSAMVVAGVIAAGSAAYVMRGRPATSPDPQSGREAPSHEGMRWIPAGEFSMGTSDPNSFANERPAHAVTLNGFWIDTYPVTNQDFRRFVESTGYVTTAERPVNWDELQKQLPPGTPKPPDDQLQPGSLVFTPSAGPVPLDDVSAWWQWRIGANWRHPEGPDSSIEGRERHPVVHVSWDDAAAYAAWVGKRLPTEAEWEYAARGGLANKRYVWGDEFMPHGHHMANTFQGEFPHHQTSDDGFARTSPVGSFKPNGYGLYDMAGNVWQWTADWYRADTFAARADDPRLCDNPAGPTSSYDPADPLSPQRVIKGGSFLCHVTYCESYRPSARRGTSPDSGLSHVGFRLVSSS